VASVRLTTFSAPQFRRKKKGDSHLFTNFVKR
jgi:hypothetical protein